MSIEPHRRIDDVADDIRNAYSFRQLAAVCIRYLKNFGASMVSYHHLPPPGAVDYDPSITVAAYGFPDAWVERYVSKRYYEIDPIPRHAHQKVDPFWWSEAATFADLGPAALAYLDDLTNAQLGDGLAIPVFGPQARNGYVGVGFGMLRPDLSPHDVIRIQWACQLGHIRYCALLNVDAPKGVSLSEREREVLSWVARGKSNAVTAKILGVSTSTVDTHMRRLYSKLGVSDRVTAALRAISLGELG